MAASAYSNLRLQLAARALAEIRERLQASAVLAVGVAGPFLFALAAFIAAPMLYAATCSIPLMIVIIVAQAALLATPVWLLRARVLPDSVLAWQTSMPLPRSQRLWVDALVALRLMCSWYLLHVVSLIIWLWKPADWLVPVERYADMIVFTTLTLGFAFGTMVLHTQRPRLHPQSTIVCLRGPRIGVIFWALLLRPLLFRHRVWLVLHVMLVTLVYLSWLVPKAYIQSIVPHEFVAFLVSAFSIALITRSDMLVSEHLNNLEPIAAAWPMSFQKLRWTGKLLAMSPAVFLPLAGCLMAVSQIAMALPLHVLVVHSIAFVLSATFICLGTQNGSRGRVGASVVAIALLSIIGSLGWSH